MKMFPVLCGMGFRKFPASWKTEEALEGPVTVLALAAHTRRIHPTADLQQCGTT